MKVLITGAAGFIGRHLVKRLATTDHRLVCFDCNSDAVRNLDAPEATLVAGDVTDGDAVRRSMQGCAGVIHLAGIYSFWEPDPRVYAAVNVTGTRNVMASALDAGVTRVVHVSTSLVYGKSAGCPFTEVSPVGPVRFSEYARTKYQGEQIAWQMAAERGMPLVVLYPASVLGAGDAGTTGRHIRYLVERRLPATALLDSVITFVHVRDVVEAIVRALEKPDAGGQKYLVGKYQLSVRQANAMVHDITGISPPRLRLPDSLVMPCAALLTWAANLTKKPPPWGMSADQMRTMQAGLRFDGSKAERELGITYTSIRTAIEDTIAAYGTSLADI